MHGNLKEWNVEKWKAFKLHKMKRKWNFANFNYKWNVAKFGNANVNLQRIWNEIAFETHWKMQREKVFDSNEKRFCISKEIPRAWRVGDSKITCKLQFSVEFPQLQSFPDAIWWKTNCLTILISNLRGIGTDQVLPMRTLSMVLVTYATISLWSISTTCTGYLCRISVIPFETTIGSKR